MRMLDFRQFRNSKSLRNDFPPGFIITGHKTGRRFIGALPNPKGNCTWTMVIKGLDEDPTIHGKISNPDEAAQIQRIWLRRIRDRIIAWDQILRELKISRRTWEGWEGTRPLPYHQAARIAARAWNATCNEEQHPSPRLPKQKKLTRAEKKNQFGLPPDLEKEIRKIGKQAAKLNI